MNFGYKLDERGNFAVGSRVLTLSSFENACGLCKQSLDVFEGVYYCPFYRKAYCRECMFNDWHYPPGSNHTDWKIDKIEEEN